MKHDKDFLTIDLFGYRPAGRPKKAVTLSSAQRQSRYRKSELERAQARKTRLAGLSNITLARYMSDPDADLSDIRDWWLEFGRRQGFK
ncbi:hypothetical protein GCM10027046_04300 [Uliginosibacterium flavum]|uniref:Integrase n=1 Tax=Uliginosibacterium flavum TaxID=1396831 RepID=A0ABV2TKC5_9RHOO